MKYSMISNYKNKLNTIIEIKEHDSFFNSRFYLDDKHIEILLSKELAKLTMKHHKNKEKISNSFFYRLGLKSSKNKLKQIDQYNISVYIPQNMKIRFLNKLPYFINIIHY